MNMSATWPTDWDDGLRKAVGSLRSVSEFARKVGISRGVVYRWKRVPAEIVVKVEAATGIPRAELRPDLYIRDTVLQPEGE